MAIRKCVQACPFPVGLLESLLRRFCFVLLLCLGWMPHPVGAQAQSPQVSARPNILWITSEDTSPNLGCYGDPDAVTPHLDALARDGVRYTRAFATAPACSPARSALITGINATALAAHNLRSEFPIPQQFKGFPAYLRAAGYYCSNNSKTDYNIQGEQAFIKAAWDESSPRAHWRKRRSGQPFFSVFNLMETHQSRTSAWSFEQFENFISTRLRPEERHDPATVQVPPYYPDTPTVRRTLARYHDCITAMDKQVGRILDELKEDGLAEDTIVFYFGDHGAGLPRGKRVLHDSGLRVPLLVYSPKKFRTLTSAPPGAASDRLLSFVDFAPTVLSLAGVRIPDHMMGSAFLGTAAAPPPRFVYGTRDRVDEAYDLSRSVRNERYLYIRNFMPHLSWNQPEGFSDQSDMRREITRLATEGKLNADQMTYAGPRKPMEELYDVQADPHQVRNLAESKEHREILEKLRAEQRRWSMETRDLGFLPEGEILARSGGATPWDFGRDPKKYPLAQIVDAADMAGRPDALDKQLKLLSHADSGVRYWAAVGLRALGKDAAPARAALVTALSDSSPAVRIEAAAALVRIGETEQPLRVLEQALLSKQQDTAVRAARALQLLGEQARPALPTMKKVLEQAQKGRGAVNLYLVFALEPAVR